MEPFTAMALTAGAKGLGSALGYFSRKKAPDFKNTESGKMLTERMQQGDYSPAVQRNILSLYGRRAGNIASNRRADTKGYMQAMGFGGSMAGARALDAPGAQLQSQIGDKSMELGVMNEESKAGYRQRYIDMAYGHKENKRREENAAKAQLFGGLGDAVASGVGAFQQAEGLNAQRDYNAAYVDYLKGRYGGGNAAGAGAGIADYTPGADPEFDTILQGITGAASNAGAGMVQDAIVRNAAPGAKQPNMGVDEQMAQLLASNRQAAAPDAPEAYQMPMQGVSEDVASLSLVPPQVSAPGRHGYQTRYIENVQNVVPETAKPDYAKAMSQLLSNNRGTKNSAYKTPDWLSKVRSEPDIKNLDDMLKKFKATDPRKDVNTGQVAGLENLIEKANSIKRQYLQKLNSDTADRDYIGKVLAYIDSSVLRRIGQIKSFAPY